MWGFTVRGSWRSNITEIFWPHCYDRHVVSFLFSWCSTGGLGPTARCWLSLLHLISIFSGPQTPSGYPRAPSVGCGFPYHISSLAVWNSTANCPCHCQLPQLSSWLCYITVQRLHDCSLNLWNWMFNCHQVEITIIQFTGHSLPVHQSISVSWALPCPISSANFRPRDFLS